MLNAERDYSLLGQRKYIHASVNPIPNPMANPKPYPNRKITQRASMERIYGLDYRKVVNIRFSPADIVYCSRVLYSAFCILQIARSLLKN